MPADIYGAAREGPLLCTANMVRFINSPTQWYDIDVVTGDSVLRGTLNPADDVDAISYNVLDDYLYGYDQTTGHIVRVDGDGNLTQLTLDPPGLPPDQYDVGGFDLNGHLFLMAGGTGRFYTVDLAPGSPTFLKLVDPANGFAEQTADFGTALSADLNVNDWTYNPADGFLYGVRPVGATAQVMRVDPATGTVTALSTSLPNLAPIGESWGSVVSDASGRLFAVYNGSGGTFRFTVAGGTAVGTRISTTLPSDFNDGAMCPLARVNDIADVGVTKLAAPNPAVPGGVEQFTLLVSNLGPDSAGSVTLSDVTPAALLSPEYSLDGGASFLPWPGALNLGDIAAGGGQTVLIRGIVDSGASGEIINTAAVDSDAGDPNPENNMSTVVVSVAAEADLAMFKNADPNPVEAGGELFYTLIVSNQGPGAAENVTLTDRLPAGLLNAEYSDDDGGTFLPWTGSLDLGVLTAGASRVVLVRAAVSPSAGGTLTNTAEVSATTPDPNPENNTASVDVTVIPGPPVCTPRCQAISDLIESVALEEAALAHILNAEGEKIQRVVADPEATVDELLLVNGAVRSMVGTVTTVETILRGKLELFRGCLCGGGAEETGL